MRKLWLLFLVGLATGFISEKVSGFSLLFYFQFGPAGVVGIS